MIHPNTVDAPTTLELAQDQPEHPSELESYLTQLISQFHACSTADSMCATGTPDDVFDILSSRQFSYLGRTKSALYRQSIVDVAENAMHQRQPIHFYYDIGGGYHAVPQRGSDLSFDVGLAELFILHQIMLFSNAIRSVYAPGIHFTLVVDNLCALISNDIPVEQTTEYCRQLRTLIDHLRLAPFIDVLVESEHTSVADFIRSLAARSPYSGSTELTAQQYNNVERFLGRHCDGDEAAERALRYKYILELSEQFLAPLMTGIHMTQRATPSTMCFRPFPGGDSRTQCGEVILTRNSKGKLVPTLMTNVKACACRRHYFPRVLPPMIPYVTVAEHVPCL